VLRQASCDTMCNKCIVRFKCYTLLQGEALLLEDGEWQQLWAPPIKILIESER